MLIPPDLGSGPNLGFDSVHPLQGGRTLSMSGATMGTGWSLTAVVHSGVSDARVRSALLAVFEMVITQMSQWSPDSEISRFNAAAAGSRHKISPQFRFVLDYAVELAGQSGGAFDPALGKASDAWGFGPALPPDTLPEDAAFGRDADWRSIAFDDDGALLQPGGLQLDLSGVAKGFAVDMGLAALEREGVSHALLEVGGELRGLGVQADGLPWWVDIESPPGVQVPAARVALTGCAIASSGNYRRRRTVSGVSWSHSLDPRTGRPLGDDVLAVSVLHKGCMQADALASAIMVMGSTDGTGFADRNGIPARIVTTQGVFFSAPWQGWLG